MKSDLEVLNRRRWCARRIAADSKCRRPEPLRRESIGLAPSAYWLGDILESAAVRVFQRYKNNGAGRTIDRDLFAFVARALAGGAGRDDSLPYGSGRRQIEQVAILRALTPALKETLREAA